MSEDRHEQEARDLVSMWWNAAPMPLEEDRRDLVSRMAAALRERDAKLEQAEAERDAYKKLMERAIAAGNIAVEERDALREANTRAAKLISAIQRGYCPDPKCKRSSWQAGVFHSPDCRVAPLLR